MSSQTPQTKQTQQTGQAERYCVVNAKGGVAKTATAANVAHALHDRGNRVLAVDADPQGGLGEITGLTDRYDDDPPSLFDVVVNADDRTHAPGLVVEREDTYDVLPSNIDCLSLERELTLADLAAQLTTDGHDDLAQRVADYAVALDVDQFRGDPRDHAKWLLDAALTTIEASINYDYIIIDAPPFYGEIFDNAVLAAPDLIVPALPEGSSQQALELLVDQLDAVQDLTGVTPHERVAVATRVPAPPTNESRRMLKWLDLVFEDIPVIEVPERVAVQYASDEGVSVLEYDDSDATAAAFREIAAYVDDDITARGGEQ